MHVLIIPSWYPRFSGDVSGSFFREQAIALKKSGLSVGLICPQIKSLKDFKSILKKPYGLDIQLDEGINVLRWHSFNYLPKVKSFSKNHWIQIGLKLFESYMERYGKPDVIHVHSMLYAGYLAHQINTRYNIPYVITEHSSAFARGFVNDDVIESLKPVVERSAKCVAVSHQFCKFLNNCFPKSNWLYIPNIVSENFFTVNASFESKKNRIISICHLNKNKNSELLIRAFEQVLKSSPNAELVIGGEGDERIKLELLVKELKIEKNVIFLGALTRDQVKEEIQKSALFVVSSKYETFGVVVVEALALGKPVVSTKCGGPESIINSEVGLLVENESILELSNGILYIYNNLEKYKPDYLRKYCLENFSETSVLSRLNIVYKDSSGFNE
ncbi:MULTISPECIES: glycosyltransferase [unclassified Acinetobacter]|uniref:glycosyltransferase n=1 Tax=unclassified Acinetobacter TaxID=196816 RepID=UPI0025764AF0|nr:MULTISPECIES: glycosyltransferase [unclassified Acinetobacter]MDM1765542.1 glycosyltransferase [Acinetobacter sp. 226-1]MDM1769134.1 glycosyltransferase [Acinetobacter sp. 226-4]